MIRELDLQAAKANRVFSVVLTPLVCPSRAAARALGAWWRKWVTSW